MKVKNKTKPLGNFTKKEDLALLDNIDKYAKLTGTTRLNIIRTLLTEHLEGKVLTNDFIVLPDVYYFNMKDLLDEGYVKASSEMPIRELEENYLLFQVPNNLDLWSSNFNTYCFDNNSNKHRGIYIYTMNGKDIYLSFSYDTDSKKVEIAVVNDLDIYFDITQIEEKIKLEKELEKEKEIRKRIKEKTSIEVGWGVDVMVSYSDHMDTIKELYE